MNFDNAMYQTKVISVAWTRVFLHRMGSSFFFLCFVRSFFRKLMVEEYRKIPQIDLRYYSLAFFIFIFNGLWKRQEKNCKLLRKKILTKILNLRLQLSLTFVSLLFIYRNEEWSVTPEKRTTVKNKKTEKIIGGEKNSWGLNSEAYSVRMWRRKRHFRSTVSDFRAWIRRSLSRKAVREKKRKKKTRLSKRIVQLINCMGNLNRKGIQVRRKKDGLEKSFRS